jgi:DHA3 family macrolide efflux protein-like MFS transporter
MAKYQNDFVKDKKYFWRMYAGQFISMITSQITSYALIWYLTDKTKDPVTMVWASLITFIPGIVVSPFIGTLIDRLNKKMLMMVSDWIVAAAAISIFFFDLSIGVQTWMVLSAMFVRSLVGTIQGPTMGTIIPSLVPEEFVPKVGGIRGMGDSAIMLASPAVGALAYANFSLGTVLLLDVVGAIFGTISMIITPVRSFIHENGIELNFIKDIKIGWSYLKQEKGILANTISGFFGTMFVMPAFSMYPLLTTNYFKGTIIDAGYVETFWAIGSLLGGAIIGLFASVHKRFTYSSIMWVFAGLAFVVMGFLPGQKQSLLAFMILNIPAGIGFMIGSALTNTITQQAFPAEKLGRVYAIMTPINQLGGPIGLAVAPLLVKTVGYNGQILIGGLGIILSTVIVYMYKPARALDNIVIKTDSKE